jgi:hypothetical protein
MRPCRPDGFVQTNTDGCCACSSRSCTTSRSLSFAPPSTAVFDAHFLLEKHGLHAHASIFFLFRIISVSLMGSLRPMPSLRRRRHLTTMPRGFYICITLSTSDIGWRFPAAPLRGRHMVERAWRVARRFSFSPGLHVRQEFILRASQAPTASPRGTSSAALPVIRLPPFVLHAEIQLMPTEGKTPPLFNTLTKMTPAILKPSPQSDSAAFGFGRKKTKTHKHIKYPAVPFRPTPRVFSFGSGNCCTSVVQYAGCAKHCSRVE